MSFLNLYHVDLYNANLFSWINCEVVDEGISGNLSDLSRAARSVVDENGVWLYHENVGPTENGYWVEAKDLREGDVFLGANGELSTLVSRYRVEYPDGITVYNFTVEGNHDYYVIAEGEYGQSCILVHNANYDKWGKGSFDTPEANAKYHFEKHGDKVHAKDIDQHIDKSEAALDMAKVRPGGQDIQGATDNVKRYTVDNHNYIDISRDLMDPLAEPKIISFGERK